MVSVEEPYDVLPVPYFPYELSALDWTFVALVLLALVSLFRYLRRSRAPGHTFMLQPLILRELCRARENLSLASSPEAVRTVTADIGLALRRVLSLFHGRDLTACSEVDLRALASETSALSFAETSECLILLERERYAPLPDRARIEHALAQLEHTLREPSREEVRA